MASITLDRVSRTYADAPEPAVNNVSLHINNGEFFALTGPTGCGKSTLLRIIAGIEECDSGTIYLNGKDITATPPPMRNMTMVFQNYALYPHMTVSENMGFALRIAGLEEAEIQSRIHEAAEIMDLTSHLNDKPTELSRVERQRVALGRAIVRRPSIYLMDEPLINMDPKIRDATREQIIRLQKLTGVTTLYVTSNPNECFDFATRIAVMLNEKICQVGTPEELRANPANEEVAAFLSCPSPNEGLLN